MSRKQGITFAGIAATALLLGLLGGRWSPTQAYLTVPTESGPTPTGGANQAAATALPGDLAGRFSEVDCTSQEASPGIKVDLDFLYYPGSDDPKRWGGVSAGEGMACQEALFSLCGVPVRYVPKRAMLNFYRPAVQVSQYVEGAKDISPACGSLEVYFDLTHYERYMYDHYPEQFGFYQYDPSVGEWQACPRVRMDNTLGENGRITCSTASWGYFALGWPAR